MLKKLSALPVTIVEQFVPLLNLSRKCIGYCSKYTRSKNGTVSFYHCWEY